MNETQVNRPQMDEAQAEGPKRMRPRPAATWTWSFCGGRG